MPKDTLRKATDATLGGEDQVRDGVSQLERQARATRSTTATAPRTPSTATGSTTPSSQPPASSKEPLATWWRQIGTGVAYIRCEVPARALPGQVLFFDEEDLAPDDKWGATFPRQKGAAIWPFAGNTSRGIVMAAMSEQGIRVLMETDDNYTLPRDLRVGDWADRIQPGDDSHSREAHMRLCKWVDGIIVATENLAEHYGDSIRTSTSAPTRSTLATGRSSRSRTTESCESAGARHIRTWSMRRSFRERSAGPQSNRT
jgi:hypothetical protein